MTADLQLGTFSYAHCFNCKYFAEIGKFDYRKNIMAKNDVAEVIHLVIICPICHDEHCEGLFPNEVN